MKVVILTVKHNVVSNKILPFLRTSSSEACTSREFFFFFFFGGGGGGGGGGGNHRTFMRIGIAG